LDFAADQDAFTFEAEAGVVYGVGVEERSGRATRPTITVTGPDGAQVLRVHRTGTVWLARADGVYTVTVEGVDGLDYIVFADCRSEGSGRPAEA
jgi:hypothetical protein